MNELNQSLNHSIVEVSSIGGGLSAFDTMQDHQRSRLHQRNQQLDVELRQLRELLAEETLQWQEKEQQYLDEIEQLKQTIAESEEAWRLKAEGYEAELSRLKDEKEVLEKEKSIAIEK